jgi:hypothetical protein
VKERHAIIFLVASVPMSKLTCSCGAEFELDGEWSFLPKQAKENELLDRHAAHKASKKEQGR